MKKSELVRNMIRDAKVAGAENPSEEFLQEVIAVTGFKRQLARAYVGGNWPKVVLKAVQDATDAAGAGAADGAEPQAVIMPMLRRGRKPKAVAVEAATAEATA